MGVQGVPARDRLERAGGAVQVQSNQVFLEVHGQGQPNPRWDSHVRVFFHERLCNLPAKGDFLWCLGKVQSIWFSLLELRSRYFRVKTPIFELDVS